MDTVGDIAYTHAGTMHADDVFSAALLKHVNRYVKIIRVNDVKEIPNDFNGIVFDIGGGKYDHHGALSEIRENGTPYASFGLLWREYWPNFVSAKQAEIIDERFIQPLDLSDNIGMHSDIAEIVDLYNLNWDEQYKDDKKMTDVQFASAVDIAYKILARMFFRAEANDKAEKAINKIVQESAGKQIIVLDRYIPWRDQFIDTDAKFVVYPSNRGEWNAQVVKMEKGITTAKIDFPAEWAGLRGENLENVSGIKGLTFCHPALFLCAGETKEALIQACEQAIAECED
jgi:uncharacterized UPF0160 family protein